MVQIHSYVLILTVIAITMMTRYVSAEEKEVESDGFQFSGSIGVGAGYSKDSQQITQQRCYQATIISASEQQAYVQLDRAISSLELENKLGVSVSVSGKYGMFAAEAKADYLRSLQDNDYAISLNYYEYATNKVNIQIADFGVDALTTSGKHFYNDGKNPYFGLLCGDYYVASYEQGALLTMGLYIKLSSSAAKEEFNEKAGFTFAGMLSAAESIKTVSAKYKITGSVTVQAFQMGGEPSQLSKILNKDSSGNYYALTCSLTKLDNCIKSVSGLLDYATNNFATQFSFEKNKGLTPLGISFTEYHPIEWIGLTSPDSLVTPEIIRYRNELSSKLKENKYYQQKLYPFFHKGYPVQLDAIFFNNANSILSKTNTNINILMQTHEGAIDCFNLPYKCKDIKANIDAQIQNITISDLKFLEAMKYLILVPGGKLYNTGGGTEKSWSLVQDDPFEMHRLSNPNITDTHCSFCIDHLRFPVFSKCYNGLPINNGTQYIGKMCSRVQQLSTNYCDKKWIIIDKQLSPFYFEIYDSFILNDDINNFDFT